MTLLVRPRELRCQLTKEQLLSLASHYDLEIARSDKHLKDSIAEALKTILTEKTFVVQGRLTFHFAFVCRYRGISSYGRVVKEPDAGKLLGCTKKDLRSIATLPVG